MIAERLDSGFLNGDQQGEQLEAPVATGSGFQSKPAEK
jgi:hypothetical protein